jgi:hypothetical protein
MYWSNCGPSRKIILTALACLGVVVIALAIALPLILLRGGDADTAQTTLAPGTTVVAAPPTTETTEAAVTTTDAATTSSTKPAANIPGDSAGRWAETGIPGLDQEVSLLAVSDDALAFQTFGDGEPMVAYMFGSGKTIQLPTENLARLWDIDGSLVVWWEGINDDDVISDAHIYAYLLPDGPKVEVAAIADFTSVQVAGGMVAWIEDKPGAPQPAEYYEWTIKGVAVDRHGRPTGTARTLVESATGSSTNDSPWTYSLSAGSLAWEQQISENGIAAGSYVMDLGRMQPRLVGSEAWRPSLDGNHVVFTGHGVEYSDFATATPQQMDLAGDFATAGPTYAAYFRSTRPGDENAWAVVARGYEGAHEEVLLDDFGAPPWSLGPIATSATHVAFEKDGVLHLFTWQGS